MVTQRKAAAAVQAQRRPPIPVFRVQPLSVLLAGGIADYAASLPVASAEVFDSATRTFSAVAGSMTTPRSNHAAVAVWQLRQGKLRAGILLAGGLKDNSISPWLAKTELFVDGQFQATGNLQAARDGALFGQVQGGPTLLIGGKNAMGALASVEAAGAGEPGGFQFTPAEPMLGSRVGHTVTALRAANRSAALLVCGGFEGDLSSHFPGNGAEMLLRQPPTAAVPSVTYAFHLTAGPMIRERAYHAVAVLKDGRALVTGGTQSTQLNIDQVHSSVEIFEPASETFTLLGTPMQSRRAFHTATTLYDGKVLVVGGTDGAKKSVNSVEIFDPATGSFSAGAAMSTARRKHTATTLADGSVLIAGGIDDKNQVLASAEIFVPHDGVWVPAGPMRSPRYGHTATPVPVPMF